jgi:hypothetical protein
MNHFSISEITLPDHDVDLISKKMTLTFTSKLINFCLLITTSQSLYRENKLHVYCSYKDICLLIRIDQLRVWCCAGIFRQLEMFYVTNRLVYRRMTLTFK